MEINSAKLLESQAQLIQKGFLESKQNWVICAPTGAGKTRMAEWALGQAISNDHRGIFIAPLKAIVEEKASEWSEQYPQMSIGLYTGETTRAGSHKVPKNENLLIMTPEKLSSYLHNWKRNLFWLSEVDVVILDEFHLLGDTHRGASLESMIGRMQRINPFVRFIGLSATISNAGQLANWLDAELFVTTWRPVPLSHRIVRFSKATDKPNLLKTEVELTVKDKGQVLVFVNSRQRSEQLAKKLFEKGFKAAFYHAGLNKLNRQEHHNAMQKGHLDVLVSTSSLEMGVNFPARKVVVYDSYVFNGESFGSLPIGRYLQCAGRAGRPGFDIQGESVLFLPKWHKDGEAYRIGMPDPIASGLSKPHILQKEIITEVATRLSISNEHLSTNFFNRTFRKASEGSIDLSHQIDNLLNAKILDRKGESKRYLVATPLGRIATQMDVSPETIRILDRFYHHIPDPTHFDCLLAVCLCPELTPKLPFYFEQIDEMADLLTSTCSHLLDQPATVLRRLVTEKFSSKALLATLKSAIVLIAYTEGESMENLANRFNCYPMDLAILKRNCDWILATAHRVFSFLWKEDWKREFQEEDEQDRPICGHERRVRQLMTMIKYGVPVNACELIKVKNIGPKRVFALIQSGITSLKDLISTEVQTISTVIRLNIKNCACIQSSAKQILEKESFSVPFDEPDQPVPILPQDALINWPKNVDPYRLRRALDLKVIHRSNESVRVEGGSEPHTIQINYKGNNHYIYQCDCMDAAKGNLCKHVMRTRLELGDGKELLNALQAFQASRVQPLRYALADLWIQGAELYDRYEERIGDYDGQRFIHRNMAAQRWNR